MAKLIPSIPYKYHYCSESEGKKKKRAELAAVAGAQLFQKVQLSKYVLRNVTQPCTYYSHHTHSRPQEGLCRQGVDSAHWSPALMGEMDCMCFPVLRHEQQRTQNPLFVINTTYVILYLNSGSGYCEQVSWYMCAWDGKCSSWIKGKFYTFAVVEYPAPVKKSHVKSNWELFNRANRNFILESLK